MLSASDIRLILETLTEVYGRGYSSVPEVGRLQAKLSVMLEIVSRRDASVSVPCSDRCGAWL
jgi:hypothetical protein